MLLDKVFDHERLLDLLAYLSELATDFEQSHDFADMISLIVIVPILFCDDERESLIYTLYADPEVQEGHVEVEKLLQAFVHAVVEVEWVNQRQYL